MNVDEPGDAMASIKVWVLEAKRKRSAPSWRELHYRSGLYDWSVEEFKGFVLQLTHDGSIRLERLGNGGLVLRRPV